MNTGLNYGLIFGHFGFPALGVTGAAMASVIAQLVNMLLMMVIFCLVRLPVEWVYFILSQEELVRLGMTIVVFRQKGWMNRLSAPG